ncbi:MAG: carboxynorspermidine decarboxylase [Bacteroidota bacterium]
MAIDFSKITSSAYVVEEALLRKNLELIQAVQERAGVKVILALKGFAMWRLFPMVGQYLAGATASSLHEARLIAEEMGKKAHTYAVAYRPHEFQEILQYSSHITFNSLSQFECYKGQARAAGASIGLRVNPGYSEVEVALYNPAADGSRLGEAPANLAGGLPLEVEGLHLHTLCESSAEAFEHLVAAFEAKFGQFIPQLQWVNFGGGHLMTRKGYDIDRLVAALVRFREKYQVEVYLEPGSAIAWETGVLVATVLDIVDNHNIKTAILDVSFTAHMPDTLEMPYRPRITGAVPPNEHIHNYRMGGTSCLAGDFMEVYGFEQPLQIGQQLIFEDMIHYTTVKTTMFNGVHHPDLCLWTEDQQLQVLRRFDYQDYKNRMN